MEEIELGVASIGAKVVLNERLHPLFSYLFAMKVSFFKPSADPGVNGKGFKEIEGVEEHTIGNLLPHTREVE